MKARLSEDGARVILEGRLWRGSFPIGDLPEQLRFYRGLRDRKQGAFAAFYRADVEALEALAREVAPHVPG